MKLSIAVAQINPTVGALQANTQLIIEQLQLAETEAVDLLVFPQLALTGYPPQDLLRLPEFCMVAEACLQQIQAATQRVICVLGSVGYDAQGRLTNQIVVLHQGVVLARYQQQRLEDSPKLMASRYFTAGQQLGMVRCRDVNIALLLGHEAQQLDLLQQAQQAGAAFVLNLTADAYAVGEQATRIQQLQQCVSVTALPVLTVNLTGGQDELVFAGQSLACDTHACLTLPLLHSSLALIDWQQGQFVPVSTAWQFAQASEQPNWADIWAVLQTGLRDYARKNGFSSVLFGLSGGLDSALVLALAVDALGAEAVECVMMPFDYTSDISREDAALQAEMLAVHYHQIPINVLYDASMQQLADRFAGLAQDVTEENLQARLRGLLLMAISNKSGKLLLSTSNKSEAAMGYSTLYGDMNGGFSPLKDVPKSWAYALANWRNQQSLVIPQRVIDRPPTAELRPEQTDQDSLPPYDQLDAWLSLRMQSGLSARAIRQQTLVESPELLDKSLRLLRLAEYKRRQSALGIRITNTSFDQDWCMPVTNGWRD